MRGEWFLPSKKVFREIQEQRNIDTKIEKWNWLKRDPEKDLIDCRLTAR